VDLHPDGEAAANDIDGAFDDRIHLIAGVALAKHDRAGGQRFSLLIFVEKVDLHGRTHPIVERFDGLSIQLAIRHRIVTLRVGEAQDLPVGGRDDATGSGDLTYS